VTLVTRGRDLFAASHVHRLLQALLGLPVPVWHHHPLLLGADGEKLAKRRGSPSLADRRKAGEDGLALAADLRAGKLPAGISLREGLHLRP
jgi:glutamyl-Q tRNA(Asp) synthetase